MKKTCYEFVGYPDWSDHFQYSKNQNQNRKNEGDEDTKKASALVAAAGKLGKVLSTFVSILNNTWIIDFGAKDHMTFNSK